MLSEVCQCGELADVGSVAGLQESVESRGDRRTQSPGSLPPPPRRGEAGHGW